MVITMFYRKKGRTPEEELDRAVLGDSIYHPVLWIMTAMFLTVEMFGCLMPLEMNLSLLAFFCSTAATIILCPILFVWRGSGMVRRIVMAGYFPVRRKEFVMSKIKIVWGYVRVFWPAVGVAEVVVITFFDMERFLLSMLAIPLFCILATAILLLIGTAGAKKGEM